MIYYRKLTQKEKILQLISEILERTSRYERGADEVEYLKNDLDGIRINVLSLRAVILSDKNEFDKEVMT